MVNITPAEVIRNVEEAASSPESLERFPLLVDFFRILDVFEKLNKIKNAQKQSTRTLTATL